MTTLYLLEHGEIHPVELVKKTPKGAKVKRTFSTGRPFEYFIKDGLGRSTLYDTWEAAHNTLIERATRRVERAREGLAAAESFRLHALNLRMPGA